MCSLDKWVSKENNITDPDWKKEKKELFYSDHKFYRLAFSVLAMTTIYWNVQVIFVNNKQSFYV